MKGAIFPLLLAASLIVHPACREKQERILRRVDGDVEVVRNHISPYRMTGEPEGLKLESVFDLDTEKLTSTGLADINTFALGKDGSIICLSRESAPLLFFRFSNAGDFSGAFGRRGEGPGELTYPVFPRFDHSGRFCVTDVLRKHLAFNEQGVLLEESGIDPRFVILHRLGNGNAVVFWKGGAESASGGSFLEKLSLFDSENRELALLDVLKIPRRTQAIEPILHWKITSDRIYVGNEQRGYEILVYDFSGRLILKIQKEYNSVPVPDELKRIIREQTPAERRENLEFPSHMSPFHSFFTDEENRLYKQAIVRARMVPYRASDHL